MSEWRETEIGLIPYSWEIRIFSSLLEESVRNGIYKSKEFHGYGSRIVNMGELFAYPRIGDQEMKKVVLSEVEKSKYILKNGDLLFARRSLTIEGAGKCVIVEKSDDNITFESSIIRARIDSNIANPEYLFFFFNSRIGIYLLGTILRVVAVAGITGTDLMDLEIPLPPIDEQNQIARILSNLDKKILLLRQQNQTLEEVAQTIFKRWFVEFNFPDKDGNPYKSSGGKMVRSELSEIPVGWTIGEISDHVKHSTKSVSPNNDPEKEFYHYSIPAFDNGRFPTTDLGASILSNKYKVCENSLLVSKLNPSTSRIWPVVTLKENAICSTEIQVFIPKENRYSFSYGLFNIWGVKKEMAQRASGTSSSHQRVRPSDILNIKCVVPKDDVLEAFEKAVWRVIKKVDDNQEEIQTLTKLRDTLLPKLMSGEIRVTGKSKR